MKEDQINKTITIGKVIALLFVYITLGAWFYHYFEKMKWVDAYYFVVITLSTIGYGDFFPKTDTGKIFTIFYIFMGIVVFAGSARYIIVSWQKHRETKNKARINIPQVK